MHILRTRFKKEIVAEFLPPTRKSNKVAILCSGMPTTPQKDDVLRFFSKKGYWVFFPRYRGSWESDGEFLKKSPHEDVIDIIDQLPKGFYSAWDGKEFKVHPSTIHLFGASFGGPAVILSSSHPKVSKVIALSPVIDWRYPSQEEPFGWFENFVKEAFGSAYRFPAKNWNKLKKGKFYNPISDLKKIDGDKIMIFHAKDDKIVSHVPLERFKEITGANVIMRKRGGHFGLTNLMEKKLYSQVKKFISSGN